jgi:hypothetical protein
MMTVAARGTRHNNRFDVVAEAFRRKEGLPFADVLTGECIQRVFREENALFGQNDLFSTDIVLWAFLASAFGGLRDGKGAACSAAVADPPEADCRPADARRPATPATTVGPGPS